MKLDDLKSLGPLKALLERQQREAAEHAAEQARLDRERRLFELSVGEVTLLRERGRADLERDRPSPEPRQRALDEQAALREALSDELNVDTLLDTDEGLSFRRREVGPDVPRRLRRGQWAIQGQVDLHGLRRDQARVRLAEYLRSARKQGLRCVRVVHGKGHNSPGRTPVLKGKVQAWLVQTGEVLAFVQARPADGGAGALLVLLKAGGPA